MIKVIACLSVLLLAACGGTTPKVVEKPVLVDRPELIVPEIQPAEQFEFEWVVLTKDNINIVMKDFEDKGQVFAVFALSPSGYQNLSLSIAELRRFITQQQSVILSYKTYYGKKSEEPKKEEEPKQEEKKSFFKIF